MTGGPTGLLVVVGGGVGLAVGLCVVGLGVTGLDVDGGGGAGGDTTSDGGDGGPADTMKPSSEKSSSSATTGAMTGSSSGPPKMGSEFLQLCVMMTWSGQCWYSLVMVASSAAVVGAVLALWWSGHTPPVTGAVAHGVARPGHTHPAHLRHVESLDTWHVRQEEV